MIFQVVRPKLCPIRIRPRGTLSTPPMVAITVGKKTPSPIVAIFEPSPMPNQMMNSGTNAIFGMGNNAATTAMTDDRVDDQRPAAIPVPMPKNVPANQPISSRNNDAERCCHSTPETDRFHNVTAIEMGDGRNKVGISPTQTPACQVSKTSRSVNAPVNQSARGENPPPRKAT